MKSILFLILLIACVIFVAYVYHKLFDVYIFSSEGLLGHLIGLFIGGGILWYLVITHWVISLIVVVIFAGLIAVKSK